MKNISKKLILSTLFIGLIIVLKAQSPIGFNFGNDNKYKLEANYSNNLGSNLNNRFLYSIYQSKFLDDKLINNTLENLNENSNLTGNTSDFEVSFIEKNNKNFFLGFAFENVNIQAAIFDADLFRLVFKGNKDFAGSSVDLSSTVFSKYYYSKFSLNFGFKLGENSFLIFKPSFVQLIDYQNLSTNNLSFYTDSSALQLGLEGELNYTNSNTNDAKGAAADISFNYFSKKHYFEVKIKDIGFVNNLKSTEYSFNESFVWEGFEANNIFNLQEELLIQDSISDLLNSYKSNNSKFIILPAFFSLEYNYKLNNSIDLGIYANYRYKTLNTIFVQFNMFQHIGNKFHINYLIAYGGYNSMSGGLNLLYSLNDKFMLSIGSRYISSAFNTNNIGGLGANINFIYQLK